MTTADGDDSRWLNRIGKEEDVGVVEAGFFRIRGRGAVVFVRRWRGGEVQRDRVGSCWMWWTFFFVKRIGGLE